MKKSTRSFLLVLLFAASFGSYWFLSHVPATAPNITTIETVETTDETNQATFVMPDVGIIKEVFELAKAFVPNH